MRKLRSTNRVAIVGFGPRGLGALEALLAHSQHLSKKLSVDVFDPVAWPGAGPNFAPDENPLCLLNIPVRGLSLRSPPYAGEGSIEFSDCLSPDVNPNTFPPRAALGTFLSKRYDALLKHAHGKLKLSLERRQAQLLHNDHGGWWLRAGDHHFGPYAEVLLAQGQPATAPDQQLARWQSHAQTFGVDLVPAYPTDKLLSAAQEWSGKAIAVRGLGLSTLDVLRLLTRGMGGRFENGRYVRSGREPAQILPFSLDGHPPVPKPANAQLDAMFDPLPQETRKFEEALERTLECTSIAELQDICEALVPPTMRILDAGDAASRRNVIEEWLSVEREQPGAQVEESTTEALLLAAAMARGNIPPSVGYTIGQLWRKWQDKLRRGFNRRNAGPDVARALISFDEGLKRYSYGPPVSSAEMVIMLIEAGIVSLRAVDDPDILLTPHGWQLIEDDTSARVSAIVDAVLPSPSLDRTSDPLMEALMLEGTIYPVAEGLGARTRPDGQAIGQDGSVQDGLSLLGRMTLGSVIAVDSIHVCFGASADRWAEGAIKRIARRLGASHSSNHS